MSRNKRRLSNQELDQLYKIENLLDNHNQEIKTVKSNQQYLLKKKKGKFDDIILSDHAYKRAKERFNMNDSTAQGYFKSILNKATRIGIQKDEQGNNSVLYAHGRIAIYLSPDLTEIKTVLKQESVTYEPIKSKVAELHAKEIRKLERAEKAKLKKLETEELQVAYEISKAKLRMHKTRSESVRSACSAYIKGLEQYIEQLKNEIITIQENKRQVCRSMVSVI
ncbi:hypothetical protein [Metabacillus sp. Hm71]|uniref:hypothetical protein n=1 Tax=Metabacillus sp. Hm71 TaxID=3450743 RepID=UPI003F43CBA2